MEELGNLWIGADFIFNNQRYCLIEFYPEDGAEDDVIATKIDYDEPHVTGNVLVSFNKSEKVKYCPRKDVKQDK